MKIIQVDNFARDHIDDILICDNVNQYFGERIIAYLNHKFSGEHSPTFFKLVEDDYKLYKYEI